MLRAAVKLPLNKRLTFSPHAGPGTSWVDDPVLVFYPSSRACARPPETVQSQSGHVCGGTLFVAVAVARPFANRTRRARETPMAIDAPYATFTMAPSGTTPSVTYRQSAMTSLRATATIPIRRARLPLPKIRLIPLRERALRLPPHPIPRELNADRLQPRIARATDPLLPRRLPAVVRRRRKARAGRRSAADSETPATPAPPRATPTRSSSPRPSAALAGARHSSAPRRSPPPAAALRAPQSAPRGPAGAPRHARAALARRRAGPRPAQSRTRRPPASAPARRQRRSPGRQPPAHLIDQPRLILRQRRPLPTHLARRLVRHGRDTHLAPHPLLAVTDPHQHPHQLERVEPIRLRTPRPPIHLDARRIHHPIRHPQLRQRPMNPEPVAARFITAHHHAPAGNPNRRRPSPEHTLDRRQDRHWPPSAATAPSRIPPSSPASSPSSPTRTPHTTSARLHSSPGGSSQSSSSSFGLSILSGA